MESLPMAWFEQMKRTSVAFHRTVPSVSHSNFFRLLAMPGGETIVGREELGPNL